MLARLRRPLPGEARAWAERQRPYPPPAARSRSCTTSGDDSGGGDQSTGLFALRQLSATTSCISRNHGRRSAGPTNVSGRVREFGRTTSESTTRIDTGVPDNERAAQNWGSPTGNDWRLLAVAPSGRSASSFVTSRNQ